MRSLLPVLGSLALSTLCAAQATYYVDAVNGNDQNSGVSRVQAFKSLTYAKTFLVDDDTLVVLPGTYSPTLTGEILPIKFGDTQSQMRLKIRCEAGPEATILDGEMMATSAGVPLMRFYGMAADSSLRGLQFKNATASPPDYWSMAIRLGSTSGSNFETYGIEIAGCIFRDGYRGIVIFGSNSSAGGTTTDRCRIHDNLFENNRHRSIAVWGEGTNYIYNNTFVDGGYEGVYIDSLGSGSGQNPSNAVVINNIIDTCSTVGSLGGLSVGTTATGNNPVIESNLANNNAGGDYLGFTPTASNLVADPMFVGNGDFHLTVASPAVQSGSNAMLANSRLDLDCFPRAHDSDGDGFAAIDRGAYQYTEHTMEMTGNNVPGGALSFNFAAPASGGAMLIFAFAEGSARLNPFGIVAYDPLSLLVAAPAGGAPGIVPFTIPNDPNLLGNLVVIQGGYLGNGTNLHLLNAKTIVF